MLRKCNTIYWENYSVFYWINIWDLGCYTLHDITLQKLSSAAIAHCVSFLHSTPANRKVVFCMHCVLFIVLVLEDRKKEYSEFHGPDQGKIKRSKIQSLVNNLKSNKDIKGSSLGKERRLRSYEIRKTLGKYVLFGEEEYWTRSLRHILPSLSWRT